MSQTVTLQRESSTDLYLNLGELVKQTADCCGIMFLYCAGDYPNLENEVRHMLQLDLESEFEVMRDSASQTIAILLPGLTLDAAHYQALRLRQHLMDQEPGMNPRITLGVFPGQFEPTAGTLKQMAETAKQGVTPEVHIFTKEEADQAAGRILIVDYDDTIREFLKLRLQMQGYETAEAQDGLEALDLIEQWEPDLVLTELNLYGVDGLPFIHQIRNLAIEQVPKIVVLTEKKVEKTISQCFQNGVDDYITKPFSPVELDARIRRCLH